MNTPKTATDTKEARDLAEHIVVFYERDVMMGQYGVQWHRDAAGAKAILERDSEAITDRVAYLPTEAAPLHNEVRAGKPPCEPKVRILGVDPAAVELQGMPLTGKTARARIVRLQDFGTGTPEGSDAWTFENTDNRDSKIFFWIYQEIEQAVRLWAGSFEFDSKRGLRSVRLPIPCFPLVILARWLRSEPAKSSLSCHRNRNSAYRLFGGLDTVHHRTRPGHASVVAGSAAAQNCIGVCQVNECRHRRPIRRRRKTSVRPLFRIGQGLSRGSSIWDRPSHIQ